MQYDEEYNTHVDQLLAYLREMHIKQQEVTAEFCVTGLEANHNANYRVREYAVKTLKIPGKMFDNALRRQSLADAMGCNLSEVPTTCYAYIRYLEKLLNVTVQYNGAMHQKEAPYVLQDDGSKTMIPPNAWDTHEFKVYVMSKFHRETTLTDFMREARCRAVDLRLPWSAGEINDACVKWHHNAQQDRIFRITADIEFTDNVAMRDRAQTSLKRLAQTCFDTSLGVDFVVSVLNKFIWQVKRKITQMPVTDHLMPVIIGSQGNGKSTLVRHLLAPIHELVATADFRQITDERNTRLWKNYGLFFDEMGWASKSDIDTVKNTITAETMTRRVMHSTSYEVIRQCATFIGTSNMLGLAEMIRDTSGTRRFVTLTMLDVPDRAVINGLNWLDIWRSVDETNSDPMLSHQGTLVAVQAQDRTLTPVEEWMATMSPITGPMKCTALFEKFREYEVTYFPSNRGTSIQAFGREMKKRAGTESSRFEAEYDSHTKTNVYYWKKEANLHRVW